MKTFNKIFLSLGVAAGLLGTSSCINDLDLLPVDPNQITAGQFGEDPEGYMNQVLADVYLNFVTFGANGSSTVTQFDGGMSTFQRGIFILEEIPTDEANWLSLSDVEYGVLQYGVTPSNSNIVGGIYSRLTINITLCNDFINTVNQNYFQIKDEAVKAKAREYVRQCKILRSVCYYYLVDLYGNVPYADENTPVGSKTAQLSRKEVFDFVTTTLRDVIAEYGSGKQVPAYGFVGKEVAQAYLMKFYLNAGVYTGTPMWNETLAVAKDIIANHTGNGFQGSGLAQAYDVLFSRSAADYALGGSQPNEIIWHLPSNDPNINTYAGGALMCCGFIANATTPGATCDLTRYNMGTGWRCMTGRRQFVEKFEWNENMSYSPDMRTYWWCTAAQGFSPDNDVLDQDHVGQNGFLPIKYTNWKFRPAADVTSDANTAYIGENYAPTYDADGHIIPGADDAFIPNAGGDNVQIPYAMVRLAEVYLSAAEAMLQGAGSKADALVYVNYIRERAGLNPWRELDLNLNTLQDERQRELYTECTRRTDLIRYGKWCTGYTWNWKGQVKYGTDLPDYSVLYPIPAAVVQQNGYTQNPGY